MTVTCPFCNSVLEAHAQRTTLEPAPANAVARGLLKPKLADLGKRIDDMSENEYDAWLDALPREQFYEFCALDEEEMRDFMFGQGRELTLWVPK